MRTLVQARPTQRSIALGRLPPRYKRNSVCVFPSFTPLIWRLGEVSLFVGRQSSGPCPVGNVRSWPTAAVGSFYPLTDLDELFKLCQGLSKAYG